MKGTAGIGKETILALAKHNPAAIYFTGRSETNASTVIEETKSIDSKVAVSFISCDQTSLASIDAAADKFLAASDRLDVLICNAGIMGVEAGLTKDGYEIQFGVNHVAHSLFIRKFLPLLQSTQSKEGEARIVILSSLGFKLTPSGGIVFDALKTTQEIAIMGRFARYGQSKLANVLYSAELANRYKELVVVALHPGVIWNTELGTKLPWFHRTFGMVATYGQGIELHEGAYTTEWAATTPKANLESGGLYEPVGKPIEHTKDSSSAALRERLWDWSQKELDDFQARQKE